MIIFFKRTILTIIGFIFAGIILVILISINLGLFVFSGGKSYGDFENKTCIDYLRYNFDTALVSDNNEINCHIEDLFPAFLAQYTFEYSVDNDYVEKLGNLDIQKVTCEDDYKDIECFNGVYKNGTHYIEYNSEKLEVIHRVNF